MSAAPSTCPNCGEPLSTNSGGLGGLCRNCLLRTTLGREGPSPTPGTGSLFAALDAELNLVPHLSGFANYEILEEIARGGMGIVFKARHRGLNRVVALKMIAAGQLANPEEVVRFRAEAEAAARFRHPNLVVVYEAGEHDGQPWFSMEYVDGPSLAKVVREGPLAPERAARYLRAVATAIQHAHDHGVFHRDLKSSNILLAPGDQPQVTDFGLAKFSQTDSGLTRTGGILGSPSYMSPEQANGGEIDGRSDVYSLGAVLYEWLTGRPPFQAPTPMATLRLLVETDPVAPSRLTPGVPLDLETICLKCLSKHPVRRYASPQALALDLEAYLDGRPIAARPITRGERAWRWCRRKPALAAALAACGVAFLAGVVGVLWQWSRAEALARRESEQRHLADRNAYAADMLLIDRAMNDRNFGYVAGLLDRHNPRRGVPNPGRDYRNWEWRYFQSRLTTDELHTLGVSGSRITAVAVSPDGRQVAAGDLDGWTTLWDASTRVELHRIPGGTQVDHLAYSPDSRWLACGARDGSTRLLDTRTWRAEQTFQSAQPATAVFSPDSRQLFLGCRNLLSVQELETGGTVRSMPLPGLATLAFNSSARCLAMLLWDGTGCYLDLQSLTGTTNRQPDLKNGYQVSLSVSPDGRRAAGTYNDNAVWVWNYGTGAVEHRLQDHQALVFRTAFSPDSRILATAGTDQVIGLWDVESGNHLGLLRGHHAAVTAVAFFPDGRRLVSGSRDRTVRVWEVPQAPHAKEPLRSLGGGEEFVLSPDASLIWHGIPRRSWSVSDPFSGMATVAKGADPHVVSGAGGVRGTCLALARDDGFVQIGDRTTEGWTERLRIEAHPGGVKWVAFSGDNQHLVTVGEDESLAVWEVSSGVRLKQFSGHARPMSGGLPRFSANGRFVTREDSQLGSMVLDWQEGRWLGPYKGPADTVTDSMLSPDGFHLAVVGFDAGVRLWDLRDPAARPLQLSAPDTGIWSTCYFPDGERLAVGLDSGEIVLWDVVAQREVVRLLEEPIPALAMGFNSEHDALVTISSRGVRVWRGASAIRSR